MGLRVGTKVTSGTEEWLIESEIKRGRFGVVFRAERTRPAPCVAAVKVPTEEMRNDPVWSKKFAREARIVANSPKHTNVVRVLALWPFRDGETAVVQEFVPNAVTLTKYIEDKDVDRVSVLLQALYALRAIHGNEEAGIVHRDIAPGNVLVDTATGTVKLIDFGLACEAPRVTEVLTETGAYFGTRGCIAPEVARDPRSADGRSDLYSLGRLFAGGLQGRDPEHAEPPRLPPLWRNICVPLTEYDPADRPQTADDAITLVMQAVAKFGQSFTDLARHVEEVNRRGVEPAGWAGFCSTYFAKRIENGQLDMSDLDVAAKLRSGVLEDFDFAVANTLFEAVETGSIGNFYRDGRASFDGVDPYGTYLLNIYEGLTVANRLRCFRTLVREAVGYHRFALMSQVRTIYGGERQKPYAARLVEILDEEDPEGVIQGRGVIPRPGREA